MSSGQRFTLRSPPSHLFLDPTRSRRTLLTFSFLAGSPTDFIMLEVDDQPALATVDETVDEKTPLMALAVGGLSA